ncbi:SDR family NAD(P)-dependent oxidoreductase [Acidobacteriota bacterium]
MTNNNLTGLEIAVIGMWGRFPGAKDLDEFWQNLKNGIETVTFFSEEELIEAGIESDLVMDRGYVKSCGTILDNKDYFDAAFFGYTPVEAETMDPQTRLLLETSWQALEDAGFEPGAYEGLIGLYGGSSWNFHWETRVHLSRRTQPLGEFASWLLYNRDNLCTLISYKLGLKGPSLFVKTTCSTSLTAVHLACQAILNGECEIALAGGVSITNWEKTGYLYQEGMLLSPDGHCRAFAAEAKGTVSGEGVGIVVLKRLVEAIEDNDHIYAVIKGTAINNDGSRKIGYTAPSIPGQADVIREALHVADVEPESITYVETHGTGTPVGDPIEIEALKTAFKIDKKRFCSLGSIKSNIGHLDAAAGIAGLIKTILALKHRSIPPSLHYQVPNSKIDFENSPFYVNTRLTPWQSGDWPLRAGVSSFGIGGTNVHVILEESPEGTRGLAPLPTKQLSRQYQLILLSAKTPTALEKQTENLINYLKKNPGINLADAAYTLQVGRSAFNHRRMLVSSTVEEAIAALSSGDSRKVRTSLAPEEKRFVVFMFPGLGAEYVNMGRELYDSESIFRQEMDRCFEILKPLLDYYIKEILYPAAIPNRSNKSYMSNINQPEVAQLVIFIFEYSLAKLLINWGITPDALIGYSFGEYAAACISGIFSLEDALNLVVSRGKLLQKTPEGAMLSVPLPEEKLLPFLDGTNLSLAVNNGPSCIVSGAEAEIRAFENRMKQNKYICVRLPYASRALHSHMMKPIFQDFAETLSRFQLKKPQIPYISNVTGQWAAAEEVMQPGYWTAHLSETVQFADGITELLKTPNSIFLEIGPGYDLSVLTRHHADNSSEPLILHTNDGARGKMSEHRFLLTRIGQLWLSGSTVDWAQYYTRERRQRISLPPYPFEGQRYWLETDPASREISQLAGESLPGKKPDIADWFYVPSWKRSVLSPSRYKKPGKKSCWLVFIDETGLGDLFAQRLQQEGEEVIKTSIGAAFKKINQHEYVINPQQSRDYHFLFDQFSQMDSPPDRIGHFWSITSEEKEIDELLDLGFYSLFYLAQAAGKQSFEEHLQIMVVSNYLQRITCEDTLSPGKAAVLGAVNVIPREYFNISCRSIDIVLPQSDSQKKRLLDRILTEFSLYAPDTNSNEAVVAYRGDYRWVQIFEPLPMEMEIKESKDKIPQLKPEGVYLITGGLGGIGLVLAEHLAHQVHAKLVLTGRSTFPRPDQWEQWLSTHPPEDRICQKIKKLQDLEKAGAEVLVCSADVGDFHRMQAVVTQALQQFGQIDGVIHAAGLPDGGVIPLRTRETIEPILAPKVKGTIVLNQVLKENNVKLDFFLLCSSISAVLGMFGQVGYCAANAFLDTFAYYSTHEQGIFTVSINWDFWQEVGMGAETIKQLQENANITDAHLLLKNGLLPSEGITVFNHVLDSLHPQVIVSTQELSSRFKRMDYQGPPGTTPPGSVTESQPPKKLYPRPDLTTEYIAAETEFEKTFAEILQTYFGFEQVGIDDNLFQYRITSLDMIHINNTLKKKIDTDIPIVVMFEYPTIHSLGHYLETQKTKKGPGQLENLDEVEDTLHQSIDIFDHMV